MQLDHHPEKVLSRLFYACGVKVSQSMTMKYAYTKTKRIANSLNISPRGKYSYAYLFFAKFLIEICSHLTYCSQLPPELRQQGTMVQVNMEDHRHEDYKQQAAKTKPFSGKGHTLGR